MYGRVYISNGLKPEMDRVKKLSTMTNLLKSKSAMVNHDLVKKELTEYLESDRTARDLYASKHFTFKASVVNMLESGDLYLVLPLIDDVVRYCEGYIEDTRFNDADLYIPTKPLVHGKFGNYVKRICIAPKMKAKSDKICRILSKHIKNVKYLSADSISVNLMVNDPDTDITMLRITKGRGGIAIRVRARKGDMGTDISYINFTLKRVSSE